MRPNGGIIRRRLDKVTPNSVAPLACERINPTIQTSRFSCAAVDERQHFRATPFHERHHFVCRSEERRARAAPVLAEAGRRAAVRCRVDRCAPPRRNTCVSGFFMAAHAGRRRTAEPDLCRKRLPCPSTKTEFRCRSNSGASFRRSPSVMQIRSPALCRSGRLPIAATE